MHLDVATWLPEIIDVHGADTSEAASAAQHLRPGAIHVYDRGIFSFELIDAQVKAKAFFVHRIRSAGERTPRFDAEQGRRANCRCPAATGRFLPTMRNSRACRNCETTAANAGISPFHQS